MGLRLGADTTDAVGGGSAPCLHPRAQTLSKLLSPSHSLRAAHAGNAKGTMRQVLCHRLPQVALRRCEKIVVRLKVRSTAFRFAEKKKARSPTGFETLDHDAKSPQIECAVLRTRFNPKPLRRSADQKTERALSSSTRLSPPQRTARQRRRLRCLLRRSSARQSNPLPTR